MLQSTTPRKSPLWLMIVLLAIVLTTVAPPLAVFAQDAGNAAGKPPGEAPQQNVLMWIIYTSGWIGGVLLIISIFPYTIDFAFFCLQEGDE